MESKPTFSYFTKTSAEVFTFYRVPKALVVNEYFRSLSSEAKLLYGLALDRMSLSLENMWFDEIGRAYIYLSIEEITELLNCGKNKAITALKELEEVGLIEKKRQGKGKSNILYLMNFEVEEEVVKFKKQTSKSKAGDVKSENSDSRSLENKPIEVCFSDPNNNNFNNTYKNKNNILIDSIEAEYAELIRDNIELDLLIERQPYNRELLEGIYDIILETVLGKSDSVMISGSVFPKEVVKSRFLKLNSSHIEYVAEGLSKNTSKVRNIKKYLMAMLFNAPATISAYYQAEVNHDMPEFVGR